MHAVAENSRVVMARRRNWRSDSVIACQPKGIIVAADMDFPPASKVRNGSRRPGGGVVFVSSSTITVNCSGGPRCRRNLSVCRRFSIFCQPCGFVAHIQAVAAICREWKS